MWGGDFLGRGTHEVAYYVMSKRKDAEEKWKSRKRGGRNVLTSLELGTLVYNNN